MRMAEGVEIQSVADLANVEPEIREVLFRVRQFGDAEDESIERVDRRGARALWIGHWKSPSASSGQKFLWISGYHIDFSASHLFLRNRGDHRPIQPEKSRKIFSARAMGERPSAMARCN
jgi:hypothetical protein